MAMCLESGAHYPTYCKRLTEVQRQRDQLLEALEKIAERTKDVSRSSHKIALAAIADVKEAQE